MKKASRILCLVLALSMMIGLFAACGGGDKPKEPTTGGTEPGTTTPSTPSTDDPKPSEGGSKKDTLIIATENETPSLSPNEHNAVAGSYMNKMTFNSLFRINENMEAVPDLVDTYEATSDTEWTMKLKQGVKFHNGEEMKADDVVATLMWTKDFPEIAQYTTSVEKVEKVDDYTIKITTPGPSASLLYDLCHHGNNIVPKSLIDSGHDFNESPIGTGPYKFVKWTRGDKLEFEMFEDYFDKDRMPTIKYVTWRVIPEGSSRTIALETGEADLLIEVEAMDVKRIQEDDKLDIVMTPSTSMNWLMINNEVPPFDNLKFRQALSAAIDREAVIDVALNGLGQVAYAQTAQNHVGYSDENAINYDPELAKQLLEESGVDATTVALPIICSNDTKRRAAEVIQGQLLENLGMSNVTIESMDLATYLSATAEGNFTASIGGYTSDEMMSYLKGVYHSNSINASNKTRTNVKEIDDLIDQALTTVDAAKREEILKQASARINADCPQISLYQDMNMRAFNKDLGGVNVNAGGTTNFNELYWK